jgi:hypothetical protein
MTFDIPYGQPLNAGSYGYINRMRKFTEFGHHLVSVVRFEQDQIIMALCRIFDVIKQLSTL